ncbi:terpenoid cyclases/protein prenyltransferase alpha-alpha toroid [Aspergillus granulosus]|uniref:Terpenoid cyclases/protein prenyltransferase alpha-alpha toroid n=1 Tax=Aspergillus granulosus TaxID=176169 RepID=A0ABR4GZG7_9EURO
MSYAILVNYARKLVQRIATEVKSKHGLSSMAASIYDTAWLAMIRKESETGNQWLFPESFKYLLDHQEPDGGWDPLRQSTRTAPYPDDLWVPDCIVHSLAALLALCRRFRFASCTGGSDIPADGLPRIFRAKRFLDSKLSILKLEGITHFGFELLVPVLLRLLAEEGVEFDFPVKDELLLRYEKASSENMDWLYDAGPCKVPLFCLEAFLEKLDFGKLSHLITPTAGITASPASTAAYLIHSKVWSDEAESYLRHVVRNGQGAGDGSVGGVFPLEVFEPSWVLTALLDNGFTAEILGLENIEQILGVIHESLSGGVVGATHCFFPDADDTSRSLTTLNLHGYHISPSDMVQRFETEQCFETFDDQLPNRVTSVSVNGNVLNALLHSPDRNSFTSQIEKVARFLCTRWEAQEKLQDHWNMSEFYGIMHLAQSLTPLLAMHDRGDLVSLLTDLVRQIVPTTLSQLLNHLLTRQHPDGSWGELHCAEETAYAVVALANLGTHPLVVGEMECQVDVSIARGKQFLLEAWIPGNKSPDRVWTGKVLHGIAYVGEAYVLAALKVNRVNLASARGIQFI